MLKILFEEDDTIKNYVSPKIGIHQNAGKNIQKA
jgi:hypothetical protein